MHEYDRHGGLEWDPDRRARHRRLFVFALSQVCQVLVVIAILAPQTGMLLPMALAVLVVTGFVGLGIGCFRIPRWRQLGVFVVAGLVAGVGWAFIFFLWSIADGHHGPLMIAIVLTSPLAAATGGLYTAIVPRNGCDDA